MRKIVVSEFITVDGVIEGPAKGFKNGGRSLNFSSSGTTVLTYQPEVAAK